MDAVAAVVSEKVFRRDQEDAIGIVERGGELRERNSGGRHAIRSPARDLIEEHRDELRLTGQRLNVGGEILLELKDIGFVLRLRGAGSSVRLAMSERRRAYQQGSRRAESGRQRDRFLHGDQDVGVGLRAFFDSDIGGRGEPELRKQHLMNELVVDRIEKARCP